VRDTDDLPRVERTDDGHARWIHLCAGDEPDPQLPVEVVLPTGGKSWQWTADGGLTPSILCHNCGTHGFWVGGEHPYWKPA
jgi:hypothetical protein